MERKSFNMKFQHRETVAETQQREVDMFDLLLLIEVFITTVCLQQHVLLMCSTNGSDSCVYYQYTNTQIYCQSVYSAALITDHQSTELQAACHRSGSLSKLTLSSLTQHLKSSHKDL